MRSFLASNKIRRGRRVGGVGSFNSPVCWLGEALGKEEESYGEPFVGAAGKFLFTGHDWSGPTKFPGLEALGLARSDMRIDNVIEMKPPENSLLRLSPEKVARWQKDWWENRAPRLGSSCNLIVACGNLALNTLRRAPLPVTKRGTWKLRSTPTGPTIAWRDQITNWRGSIFSVRFENGETLKCIPAIHPASIIRGSTFYDAWVGDLERIVGDSTFPELRLFPNPEILVDPTERDCWDFLHEVERTWKRDGLNACLAADIETVQRTHIDLIGFSLDPKFALVMNTGTPFAWRIIALLLKHQIPKGFHYGIFDTYVLSRIKGFQITRPLFHDSQLQHHCLDPRDQHRLGYCGSRDLRVKFWKTERDKEDETSLTIKDPRRRKRYNGKDVSYTRALIDIYRARLSAANLRTFYRDHYRRLGEACLRLSLTGFKVDHVARKKILRREDALLVPLKERVIARCGNIFGKTGGFSSPKVAAYFYDTLGCKPYTKRGTGNRTADELAIRKLKRRYKKARPAADLILAYRQHKKIRQEVRSILVDDDGRMRSRFSPTAATGRLRARKTPIGTGVNLQNRDRHSDLRTMFIPDPGHVLIELDLSQAEDRIVDGKSGDPDALREVGSIQIDRHIRNAAKIFHVPYDTLLAQYKAGSKDANEKRQFGKKTRHSINYKQTGAGMADSALVESEGALVLDPDECDEWIEALKVDLPGIPVFHAWIDEEIATTGYLEDSWGWRIYFKGLRISHEDQKAGYAWHGSDEVAKLMNQYGFVLADEKISKTGEWEGAKIVQQGHDSVVLSTPPRLAWDITTTLVESLNRERTYPGANGSWKLKMPVGIKVMQNWKSGTEWQQLPSKGTFMQEVRRIVG